MDLDTQGSMAMVKRWLYAYGEIDVGVNKDIGWNIEPK